MVHNEREESHKEQTSDLSTIIQPLINQNSWSENNPLVFIIKGDGKRVAKSYNGDPTGAPKIHVEYSISTDSKHLAPDITLNGKKRQ